MEYLSKKDIKQQKDDFNKIIVDVRAELKLKNITFEAPKLVGSAKRNLVLKGNENFDLDYQIRLSKFPDNLTAKEIKFNFIDAFNIVAKNYSLEYCEDSTHVITLKRLDSEKVIYAYDVAILRSNILNKYIILKNEKNENMNDENYHFIELSDCYNLDENYAKIKGVNQWEALREKYKEKKEAQVHIAKDDRKHSISLLKESINEIIIK